MQRVAVLVRTVLLVVVVGVMGFAPGAAGPHRVAAPVGHRAAAHEASASAGVRAPRIPSQTLTLQRHADKPLPHSPGGAAHTESGERQDLGTWTPTRTAQPTSALPTRPPTQIQTRAPPA